MTAPRLFGNSRWTFQFVTASKPRER